MTRRTAKWFTAMEDKGLAAQDVYAKRHKLTITNSGWSEVDGVEGRDPFVVSICSKLSDGDCITTNVLWNEQVTHSVD